MEEQQNGHTPRRLSPTERLRIQLAQTTVALVRVTAERDQLAARVRLAETSAALETQTADVFAAHGVSPGDPWVCDIETGEFSPKGG